MPVTSKNLSCSYGDAISFPCLAQDYNQTVLNLTGAQIVAYASKPGATLKMVGSITGINTTTGAFTVTFNDWSADDYVNENQELVYSVYVLPSPGTATYTVQSGILYISKSAPAY